MSISKIDFAEAYTSPANTLDKVQPLSAAEAETGKEVPPINKVALESAVKKLNELVAAATTITFSLDEESGKPIIKVIDSETQTVLRQIPNEEALAMSRNMDRLQGLILRQQA